MKALIEFLAQSVVDQPQDIRIEERKTKDGLVYQIYTHPDDKGRIIGRGGKVIESIRTVARSFSKGRITVEIR